MTVSSLYASHHGVTALNFSLMTVHNWDAVLTEKLATYQEQMSAIGADTAPPTFANTLEQMEQASYGLGEAFNALSCAQSHATPDLQDLMAKWMPRLSEASAEVMQNDALYNRVKEAGVHQDNWTPAQKKLYKDTVWSFQYAGAGADDSKKAKLLELTSQMAVLENEFDTTNLANANVTVDCYPTHLLDSDRVYVQSYEFVENDRVGYRIPVSSPYVEPLLAKLSNRPFRETLYKAWVSRGTGTLPNDTSTVSLIENILNKRQQMADLHAFSSWSDFVLHDQMAKNPQTVQKLLMDVWNGIGPSVSKDLNALLEFAITEGFDSDVLKAWDVPYYAERLRQKKFDLDSNEVRQYLALSDVRAAAFDIAGKVFGLKFEEDASIPTYHDDVRGYHVTKNNTNIGTLLIDDFARSTKAPGAWMNQFATGNHLTHNNAGVINVLNVPHGDNPLISYDEAVTIFHELGHALHGLLGKTTYPSQAGTNVCRDFVELPSQIMENWITNPSALKSWAKHHQTGEPIPEELVRKLEQSQKFGQSFHEYSYLQSAVLDLMVHWQNTDTDIQRRQSEILKDLGASDAIAPRHHLPHFSHLFGGGYSSRYYSYLWARVLEVDAFARFEDEGLFDPKACADLSALFEAGGSDDPLVVFEAFRGRAPTPDALFKRMGVEVPSPHRMKQ